MKAKRITGSPESLPYKMEVQKQGIHEPGIPSGIPVKATPVTTCDPGLGAKNISHPYKKGKQHI